MKYYKNGIEFHTFRPEYTGQEIIVAIDSSKTDSAIIVADKFGNPLNDYDICGSSSDDIYWQTCEQRKFIKTIFNGAKIILGGIEDIITRKSKGMEEHESRLKITLVYASFISSFQDYLGYTLDRVNNWAWKSDILPEEYRTQEHYKGSKDWCNDTRNKYAGRNDNITDAYCILLHLLKSNNISNIIEISSNIEDMKPCDWVYVSGHMNLTGNIEFKYNESLSIEQNIAFVSNRLPENNTVCFFKVPTNKLDIKEIYNRCYKTFARKEDELIIMIYKET